MSVRRSLYMAVIFLSVFVCWHLALYNLSLPISSSALSSRPPRLLTIAVDNGGSCPDKCAFIHLLLPDYVQWRYVSFRGTDIASLDIRTDTLVVARYVSSNGGVATWARQFRVQTGLSVGLMLMADEQGVVDKGSYASFDYVLRNYYFPGSGVRALGNLTCESVPAVPWVPDPALRFSAAPWLGVHWMFLLGRDPNLDANHSPHSFWPALQRPRDCTFVGCVRGDRQEMIDVMKAEYPTCDIHVQRFFGGSMTQFRYSHEELAGAIFGLNPTGNNVETHRLKEILDQGTIPVMLHAPFLDVLFEPMPGVITQNWGDAAREMRRLLDDGDAVNRLQLRVVRWSDRLMECMRGDIDLILRAAFSAGPEVPSGVPTTQLRATGRDHLKE